jgi:hypothetical protein
MITIGTQMITIGTQMITIGIQYKYCCHDTVYCTYEIATDAEELYSETLNLLEDYTNYDRDLAYDGNPFPSLLEINICTTSTRDVFRKCDYRLTHTMC